MSQWFKCFPASWIAVTTGLSHSERGKAWLAMFILAEHGPLPIEVLTKRTGRLSDAVMLLLDVNDGMVSCPMVDRVTKPSKKAVVAPRPADKPSPRPRPAARAPRAAPKGPNPEINELVEHLTKALAPAAMDGTIEKNRQMAKHLLNKMAKSYPSTDPVKTSKRVIDLAMQDGFHRTVATNFDYIYRHATAIIRKSSSTTAVEEKKKEQWSGFTLVKAPGNE